MAPAAITPPATEAVVSFDKVTSLHKTNYSTAKDALDAAKARFVARNPISQKLHEEAVLSLPGGNTRSLLHNAPFPVFISRGTGYQVISEDGHTYTDLVGELTAGLFGHSNPLIHETLKSTLDNVGLSLGATTRLESQHARLICELSLIHISEPTRPY